MRSVLRSVLKPSSRRERNEDNLPSTFTLNSPKSESDLKEEEEKTEDLNTYYFSSKKCNC